MSLSSLQTSAQEDHCSDAETYYSLEEALEEPNKVVKLDIAMLKLTSISPDIAKLVNLVCLDLSFNRISTLPKELAELKNLEYLNLAGTRYLAGVPEIVANLPSLKILDIKGHPEWGSTKFEEAKKLLPGVTIIMKSE